MALLEFGENEDSEKFWWRKINCMNEERVSFYFPKFWRGFRQIIIRPWFLALFIREKNI